MKNRFGLYFAIAAAAMLAGCSLASPEEDFYRVDYYSDYAGIEEDLANNAPDISKAVHLGHAFAKKETTSIASDEQEIVTYSGVGEPTKLEDGVSSYRESTREAPEGFSYCFNHWAGYYDDGTEIDLKHIKASCSVFAIYELVAEEYLVTIEGYASTSATYLVAHGDSLAACEDYAASPMVAEPTHDPNDEYYETSALLGVEAKFGDADFVPFALPAGYTEYYRAIEDSLITGKTTFRFVYGETVKNSYTVRFKCVDEDDETHILNAVEVDGFATQSVVYGEALVKPDTILDTEWKFIRCSGAYSEQAKALNGNLDKVDVDHIFYDCEVTLVYRRLAIETNVNVYDDKGDLVSTQIAYDGVTAPLPSPTISDDYSFTGIWVHKDTMEVYDPSALLSGDIDVVPLSVKSSVTKVFDIPGAKLSIEFLFNRELGGYLLNEITENTVVDVDLDLTEAQLTCDESTLYHPGTFFYRTVAVQAIGSSAIAQHVTSMELPNTIKQIKGSAFRSCVNLSSLDLSGLNSLTDIGAYAFDGCSNLSSISFPSSLKTIGSKAFYRCASLTSLVFQEGLEEIGANAFDNCSHISSVTLPASLKKVGDKAFYRCSLISSLTFQEGLEDLGNNVFENCTSLAALSLPSTLEAIGSHIAEGCASLAAIDLNMTAAEAAAKTGFLEEWNYNGTVAITVNYAA